jgi:hypothetical protein
MKRQFRDWYLPLDLRHYRFDRQCEYFAPERDSHGWAWWLAGVGCAAILLALGFFA